MIFFSGYEWILHHLERTVPGGRFGVTQASSVPQSCLYAQGEIGYLAFQKESGIPANIAIICGFPTRESSHGWFRGLTSKIPLAAELKTQAATIQTRSLCKGFDTIQADQETCSYMELLILEHCNISALHSFPHRGQRSSQEDKNPSRNAAPHWYFICAKQ